MYHTDEQEGDDDEDDDDGKDHDDDDSGVLAPSGSNWCPGFLLVLCGNISSPSPSPFPPSALSA